MGVTEGDCFDALREAADRLGESSTKAEYEEFGLRPAHSTILRVMGSWNEAKEAAGLETYTQAEGGGTPVRPQPDRVELPDGYEWAELTPQQRWYYENREHRIAVKTRRRNELQRWLYGYKCDECCCKRCGEGSVAVNAVGRGVLL